MDTDIHRIDHLNKLKDLNIDLTTYMTNCNCFPITDYQMDTDSHRIDHLNKLKDLSIDLTTYMTNCNCIPFSYYRLSDGYRQSQNRSYQQAERPEYRSDNVHD